MVKRTRRKMNGGVISLGTTGLALYRLLKEKMRTKSSHELLQEAVNKLEVDKIKGIITIDPSVTKKPITFLSNITYEIADLLCSAGYIPTTDNLEDILYTFHSNEKKHKFFDLLIKHGADINGYIYDKTLPQIFLYDEIDDLKFLIERGADINKLSKNNEHICEMYLASIHKYGINKGDYERFKLLKDNGLDLKKCFTNKNNSKLFDPPKSKSRSRKTIRRSR